ncbi:MAG: signal recognition particle-docking protein FtsY [Conexivisphaerales archaeon]
MLDKLRNAFSRFQETLLTKTLKDEDITEALSTLEINLLESEVAIEVVDFIKNSLRTKLIGLKVERKTDVRELLISQLREVLLKLLDGYQDKTLYDIITQSNSPYTILFLGINGTGKTTTIAKVAYFLKKKGITPVMAASDTYRAGAIEQLGIHAQKLNVKILKQKYGADPAAVARDAKVYALQHGVEVVLIDTAGRMQTSRNLMDELAKVKRVASPNMTIFVGDALAGNDLIIQAREFEEKVGFDAFILTKIDADIKGGSIINASFSTQKPILFLGTGQTYEDLIPFNPNWVIDRLLG